MKNWLDIAKEENNKFNNSEYGKLSDSKVNQLSGAKDGGQLGGLTNKKSGHMSELGKKNGKKNANHPKSIAASKINGQKNVERKFWEDLTFEQRSKGGKESYKKHIESGHIEIYRKMGTEASVKARIERANEKYKILLDLIPTDTFITKDMKDACNKLGYSDGFWKSMLKNKKYVTQIHKGENQFNPSIYKKVI